MFFFAAGWEVVRFVLLILIVLRPSLTEVSLQYHTQIVWFGAPQLALAASFLLLGRFPLRYRAYVPVLTLGKLLGTLAGAAAVVPAWMQPGDATMLRLSASALVTSATLVLDLIILTYLISYRAETHAYRLTGNADSSGSRSDAAAKPAHGEELRDTTSDSTAAFPAPENPKEERSPSAASNRNSERSTPTGSDSEPRRRGE